MISGAMWQDMSKQDPIEKVIEQARQAYELKTGKTATVAAIHVANGKVEAPGLEVQLTRSIFLHCALVGREDELKSDGEM
jgi:hypothetical protein